MILLQRPDPRPAFLESGYALGRSGGSGDGGDVGHLVLDGRFADIGVVILAGLAYGSVDHQLDLAIFYGVIDIGPAFMQLQYQLRSDAARG